MSHKSVIWTYVINNPVDNSRATCLIGNEKVSHGGDDVVAFTQHTALHGRCTLCEHCVNTA